MRSIALSCRGLVAAASLVLALGTGDRLPAQSAVHEAAEAPSFDEFAPAVTYARAVLETMRTERGVPGLSAAVGVEGRIVFAEAFGWADLEGRVPASRETKFRVGSVSKPLTAAAMGLLVQRGRLDLDLPVQRYVPSFPEKRWPITSRMVAGHLAGIRHYDGEEFLSTRRYATVAEGLEIFAEDSLLFEPGEQFRYSSYGWNLLSAVVEGASDEEFLSFMDREVFEPLGMMSTVADHADSIVPYRTRFYEVADDGRIYNSPFVDNSYKWAGGGFLSTPSDLVRFGMAHLDGSLLRPEIIEMMWTSQKTAAGEETQNGVGWFLDRAFDGGRVVSHGGGSIGGVTYLLLLPDSGVVVALTANVSQGVGLQRAAHLLAEAFLNPPSVTTRPDVAVAASWAGGWRCEAFMEGQLRAKADFAFVERAGRIAGFGGWEIQLEDEENVPTDVTVGWSDPESHRLSFVTVDDRGNPTRITLERAASPSRVTGTWFDGNLGTLSCTR